MPEVELEEAFGPEFKPDVDDEEPFDLISLDIFLLLSCCFCALDVNKLVGDLKNL